VKERRQRVKADLVRARGRGRGSARGRGRARGRGEGGRLGGDAAAVVAEGAEARVALVDEEGVSLAHERAAPG
jgi:hypothetical protein